MKRLILGMALWSGVSAFAGTAEEGFVPLFNGRDLAGWTGNTNVYWVPAPGILQCGGRPGVTARPDDALMTVKEYADFIVRFDFRTEQDGDNGFGFRYPGVDDMAYSGVEMQLADTVGKHPDAWRAFGGLYGLAPALDDRRADQPHLGATYVKPVGAWNACEVRACGTRIEAWVNGVQASAVDLAAKSPYTGYDKHAHSGVRSRRGHFVWWVGNPKVPVQWRNLRVKELKPAGAVNAAQRRFLYSDFKDRKVVYIDEANPDATWAASLPAVAFDITRHGLHRLYAAQPHGWRVYNLAQLRFLKAVEDPAHVKYATSAVHTDDGRTFVLEQNGAVHEFDAQDKWAFTYTFPKAVRHGRALRFTDRGTALLGIDDGVAEVRLERAATPDRRLLRLFTIPGARSAYQGAYLADGRMLVSGGYLPEFATFSPDGRLLSRMRAEQPEGLANFFYGGFDFRPNGHVMVANWTGHDERDFKPGWKILEFDAQGRVVWHWNNPLAGTPNAVIPLD